MQHLTSDCKSGVTGLNLGSMIVAIVGSIVVLMIYNAVTGRRSP